jgi:hypothetical protein
MGCKPDGDVCKLKTMSCNASCDCCAGNCENEDTCHQDILGVPRCSGATCVPSDGACASDADCCNLSPCVPNPIDGGTPPYVCFPSACVPACGPCTVDADCCVGEQCVLAVGSAMGFCGPCGGGPDGGTGDGGLEGDGGMPCVLYGQLCTAGSDCCGGVPCTNGRCVEIAQ